MATTSRIDSTQLRLISLEKDGQWLLDHHEAEECHKCGVFVADVNRLFGDVFELDVNLREETFGGIAYSAELGKTVEILFLKCFLLATTAERLVNWFGKQRHSVEGADTLRSWLRELEACNRPSGEVPDWLEEKRLAAVEEHRQGKTLAGWAD